MTLKGLLQVSIALITSVCACRADTEPSVIDLGSIVVLPVDLPSQANDLRGAQGMVFVGRIEEAPQPSDPAEVHAGSIIVQYPAEAVEIEVEDALGETIGDSIRVAARNGMSPILLDLEREPLENAVVSGGAVPEQHRLALGRSVFFISPSASNPPALVWRADFINDQVSGAGTQSGNDVSIEALRVVE